MGFNFENIFKIIFQCFENKIRVPIITTASRLAMILNFFAKQLVGEIVNRQAGGWRDRNSRSRRLANGSREFQTKSDSLTDPDKTPAVEHWNGGR